MNDYGERKCLMCGTQFTASYAAQVVCSTACRKARDRKRSVESCRRYRASVRERLARIPVLEARILELESEISKLREKRR